MRSRKPIPIKRKPGRPLGQRIDSDHEPTPRQRLDMIHAQSALFELQKKRGLHYSKAEIDAERAETAEIIRSDLGALGKQVSEQLSGCVLMPVEAQRIIDRAIYEMVKRWHAAGRVNEEAVPK